MRRYLALWAELFRLSLKHERAVTLASLAAAISSIVVVAAVALSLRAVVDATASGLRTAAVVAAVGAALAYALNLVLTETTEDLIGTATDRLGRLQLHPSIHADILSLDGLDHLERSDYLDRLTLVRRSQSRLVGSMWAVVTAVVNISKLLVTLILLGTVSPWLLLLSLFAYAPIWSVHRGQRAVTSAEIATAEASRLQQQLFDLAVDASAGKDIRLTGAGPEIVGLHTRSWHEAMRRRFRARLAAGAWKLAGWTVFSAAFTGGLALVMSQAFQGSSSLGDLVMTVTVAAGLRQTVQSAVASTTETAGAGRTIDPYLWMRDFTAERRQDPRGTTPPPARLADGIRLEQVGYTYPGAENPALQDVSVRLPAGSVVAIVGEYGSGKTTLVKLLAKFYRPDSGRISIDGQDLSEVDTAAWRARITAAFQDFGRFRTTFAETVGLGDLDHLDDHDRIRAAVSAVDADGIVAKLPQGLATQLGRELGGVELSEGQWQKTALARAALRESPLLLLFDEPTASLDAPSEQAVYREHMARGRAQAATTGAITLIVSHRFSTVTGADLILVMEHGRVIEQGTHDELIRGAGKYAQLYEIQAHAYRMAPG